MCRYKSEGDSSGLNDCDSLRRQNEMNHDLIRKLRAEIARLRESLAIFVHAHATGNSVPPHIEKRASALVKEVGRE